MLAVEVASQTVPAPLVRNVAFAEFIRRQAGQDRRHRPSRCTSPLVNKGERPKGIAKKVTPTVEKMILKMRAEKVKVTHISKELRLSRQTVYEVLKRA